MVRQVQGEEYWQAVEAEASGAAVSEAVAFVVDEGTAAIAAASESATGLSFQYRSTGLLL